MNNHEYVQKLGELTARRNDLADEARLLADKPEVTPGEDQRLDRLLAGVENIDAEIRELEDRQKAERAARVADAKGREVRRVPAGEAPTYWRQTDSRAVFDAEPGDRHGAVDMARRALDVVLEANQRAGGAEMEQRLQAALPIHFAESPHYADRFRAVSNPDYVDAFTSLVMAPDAARALLRMTDAQREALRRVERLDAEARAMSLTDANGGYLVPTLLDPTLMLNSTQTPHVYRQVARVVTGTGDVWRGVSSTGITAAYGAEGSTVGDNSPTLAQPAITAHTGRAFVPYGIELEMDAEGLLMELRRAMTEAQFDLEHSKFTNGSGTNEPYGLLDRLADVTNSRVVVTTDGAFGAVDLKKAWKELPQRYRPRASWMMNVDVENEIRGFSSDNSGAYYTVNLTEATVGTLFGRPVYTSDYFPEFTDTTGAANVLTVGDLSGYIIFDRLGSARVEVVQHLVDVTNNRPTMQRGLLYYWRNGADLWTGASDVENGLRVLVNE